MPSVHCVTRSCTKLTMMRGENCMEASVSVISRMAKTMDTTVMMEAAMPPRMTCATCGSACEGNSSAGHPGAHGGDGSLPIHDRNAPAAAQRQRDASAGGPGTRHAGCTSHGGAVMAGVCARFYLFKCRLFAVPPP